MMGIRCRCIRPENPDRSLIRCINEKMPLLKEAANAIESEDQRLPSPSELGTAQTAEQSIDVKLEKAKGTIKLGDVEKARLAVRASEGRASISAMKKRSRSRKSVHASDRYMRQHLSFDDP
jgi:hypothetical protein